MGNACGFVRDDLFYHCFVPVREETFMTPIDKLIALLEDAIAKLPTKSALAFEKQLTALLVRGHTAAFLAATATALGVRVDTLKGLSKAERADIKAAVAEQIKLLGGFVQAWPSLSAAQRAARAQLYAGSVLSTFNQARWGQWKLTDDMIPGKQKCAGNCGCEVSVADNGDGTGVLTRRLGSVESSCSECPPLAGDYAVRRRRVV